MVILATPVASCAWLSVSAVMLSPTASKDRACDETRDGAHETVNEWQTSLAM